jgi:hypothetical protein
MLRYLASSVARWATVLWAVAIVVIAFKAGFNFAVNSGAANPVADRADPLLYLTYLAVLLLLGAMVGGVLSWSERLGKVSVGVAALVLCAVVL